MSVSGESGLLESSSEAVEKLPESGVTVKKESEESKYAALIVLKAASFWALKESVRGRWQEGQGQGEEEGLLELRREGSFIFFPMMPNEIQIQIK